jgi:hypothetical protein
MRAYCKTFILRQRAAGRDILALLTQAAINQPVVEGITSDLIKPIGEGLAVNPEFESAIAFIFDNEDI